MAHMLRFFKQPKDITILMDHAQMRYGDDFPGAVCSGQRWLGLLWMECRQVIWGIVATLISLRLGVSDSWAGFDYVLVFPCNTG